MTTRQRKKEPCGKRLPAGSDCVGDYICGDFGTAGI